jgi:hypothetical protein
MSIRSFYGTHPGNESQKPQIENEHTNTEKNLLV